MLHCHADPRLSLIRLGDHLPLVPCRHGRDLGAHLSNASSGAMRGGVGLTAIYDQCASRDTHMHSCENVLRMHGAPVDGPTEPRRFRDAFGGPDGMSSPISSSFTLSTIGAGSRIFLRAGPPTSTACCVLQTAPIASHSSAGYQPLETVTRVRQGMWKPWQAEGASADVHHVREVSASHDCQKLTAAKSALPPHRMMPTR